MPRTTKDDLLRMDRDVITGTMAAEVLGMHPSRLIGYARERPEAIQFGYQLSGNRMKIPRIPFLRWLGCTEEEIKQKTR